MSTDTTTGRRPPAPADAPSTTTGPAQASDDAARASRLDASFEPIAASVYFAPEVHAAFHAAGLGPPAEAEGCLPLADLPAYYCSAPAAWGRCRARSSWPRSACSTRS